MRRAAPSAASAATRKWAYRPSVICARSASSRTLLWSMLPARTSRRPARAGLQSGLCPGRRRRARARTAVIGSRSFGSDPELCASLAGVIVKSLRAEGIVSCLKHFPGYGSATVDDHNGTSIVEKSLSELEACDLSRSQSIIAAEGTSRLSWSRICPTRASPAATHLPT